MSLTRIGATRQSLWKAFVVSDAPADSILRSVSLPRPPAGAAPVRLTLDERVPGLCRAGLEGVWLGTPESRDESFRYLGAVFAALRDAARRAGGMVHAPGVRVGRAAPQFAGDLHALRVVDSVEQEVLVNLLRKHSPVLIAMSGRGLVGATPDRIGSRWLATSREHLATRYLASADPRHLHRVRAEIRRRDGIADLARMDVAPGPGTAGETEVVVRCLDAQLSLAEARAQALLLTALGLHARRMVKAGRRTGNVPQRMLEENRARAVIHGLGALFVEESGRDQPPRSLSAREAARRLLDELLPSLSLLDATAEELLPLIAPIEAPGLGLPPMRGQDLLARMARRNPAAFPGLAEAELADPTPGGTILQTLRRDHPGRAELLLEGWRTALADGRRVTSRPPRDQAQRRGRPAKRRGGGRSGS